jgi:hypothetical protein
LVGVLDLLVGMEPRLWLPRGWGPVGGADALDS